MLHAARRAHYANMYVHMHRDVCAMLANMANEVTSLEQINRRKWNWIRSGHEIFSIFNPSFCFTSLCIQTVCMAVWGRRGRLAVDWDGDILVMVLGTAESLPKTMAALFICRLAFVFFVIWTLKIFFLLCFFFFIFFKK